jgi:hypothetical protein
MNTILYSIPDLLKNVIMREKNPGQCPKSQTSVFEQRYVVKCYNCAGFDDASQNCPSELFFTV